MMPIAQNRSHSAAVLELLCAQFPRCFHDEARRQPLKIGIHNDVLLALGDAVTPSELARALIATLLVARENSNAADRRAHVFRWPADLRQ